jgi:hypothetical protein
VEQGKLIGAKPPLQPRPVWSIHTKLQVERRRRDLAMSNLAIDSKLRGYDVVVVKVEDITPNGYALVRATARQKKTGRPVRFELTEQTRQAFDGDLKAAPKLPCKFVFTGRRGRAVTTRQYACLVSDWIGSIGLDPRLFGTPLPALDQGADLPSHRKPACGPTVVGPFQVESTLLGIEVDDALAIAEQVDV